MPSDLPPSCPACGEPMSFGGLALCDREGVNACRGVWGCPLGHVWWQWADRPKTPPEPCPYPDLFQG